ncbi:unnamed protein product [Spirodela intermedia]|uniref:INO80 complex subunit B-like conserved region domain-containing protein n=1 Tax=Spirodela intermedia TaxID=51605 RepID=A0A7I8INR8_SPIIN|nr:unnamed protein product [Spirodela intermedia]CAA6658637.1 unnamed protein product [Spirodela intermedia]
MAGGFGVSGVSGVAAVMKKSRTATSRRPRQGPQMLLKAADASPHSSTPSSESSKGQSQSPDVSSGPDSSLRRKEMDLNNLVPKTSKQTKRYEGPTQGYLDSTRSKEGMLAPANWKSSSRQRESPSSDSGRGNRADASDDAAAVSVENRLRKVKLKVGGVTRTIHAKEEQRLPRKRAPEKAFSEEGEEDDDYDHEDDEIRYLERLRASRASSNNGWSKTSVPVGSKMERNAKSAKRAYEEGKDISLSRQTEGRKKPRSGRDSEDDMEEEEAESDAGDVEGDGQGQEALDSLADGRRELSLTTRQRAIRFAKDGSGGSNTSLIEFPNGLPAAPSRKQKEKLSEVEQQLKKAEAAQRRSLKVEKAAREAEAEAIRKILGQDSSRKKREEKLQKKRDELAQIHRTRREHVRWVMGPTGTIVTFPEAVGLPSIFSSKPCGYPPPREKCAGPSCSNACKYRDSKSNLPLCSLQCYRAVQRREQPPVQSC